MLWSMTFAINELVIACQASWRDVSHTACTQLHLSTVQLSPACEGARPCGPRPRPAAAAAAACLRCRLVGGSRTCAQRKDAVDDRQPDNQPVALALA
jgi:hypothetical protein